MSDEKERGVIFTPKNEVEGRVDELPVINEIDIRSVKTPEEINAMLPKDVEALKDEAIVEDKFIKEEVKEFTEEEKKAIYIQNLKESHIRFRPIKHPTFRGVISTTPTFFGRVKKEMGGVTLTNLTTTKFGAEYRKKRQKKNKMARASRKVNR